MAIEEAKLVKQVRIFCLIALPVLILTVPASPQTPASAPASSDRAPGSVGRDCPDCPEMVVIPWGSFTMGLSTSAGYRDIMMGFRVARMLP